MIFGSRALVRGLFCAAAGALAKQPASCTERERKSVIRSAPIESGALKNGREKKEAKNLLIAAKNWADVDKRKAREANAKAVKDQA